jgi:hypothetical protein
MRKAMTGLILCVRLILGTPAGAQDAKAVDPSQEGVQFNERVVELTEPVVRGLLTGLDREIALLTEFRDLLETYKTSEEYDVCQRQVAMSPESQKIVMQIANLPTNSTMEQVQRVTEKMNTDINALLKRRCGDNIDEEWPPGKRMERVKEIHQQAAAAAGLLLPGTPPPPPRRGGPWIDDATTETVQASGSTAPYDIALERIDAYCKYKKKSPSMFPMPPGYNLAISASIIDPFNASLRNHYYSYTPAEMAAIEPMCESGLIMAVGEIEILMDDIKITGKAPKKRKH